MSEQTIHVPQPSLSLHNPYLDELRQQHPYASLTCYPSSSGRLEKDADYALYKDRYLFVRKYSWAIPNANAIEALVTTVRVNALRAVIEIGAGTGYWASLLAQFSINTLAFDTYEWAVHRNVPQHYPVAHGGPEKASLLKKALLFLCWPPMGEYKAPTYPAQYSYDRLPGMAGHAIQAFEGEFVAYVGEGESGCTGDPLMWKLLQTYFTPIRRVSIPQYRGLHDQLTIYRRRLVIGNALS